MRRIDRHGGDSAHRPGAWTWRRMAIPYVIAIPALFAGCATIVIHERPILDRSTADVIPVTETAASDAHALIEAGAALDHKHPEWALAYFRDAALSALPQVVSQGVTPRLDLEGGTEAQSVYRRAIEYALENAQRQAALDGCQWTDILRRVGIEVQGQLSLYEATRCDEVLPARRFEIQGFRHHVGRGGMGAPVVAHVTRTGKWGEPGTATAGDLNRACKQYFPASLYYAASAIIRPGNSQGEMAAVLELHDPVRDPDLHWQPAPGAPRIPLAYDMTVPLARQFHVANLNLLGALAVLYPSEYNGRTGIYMLDPYEPGKIPVVFVHGLMSSPEAWDNAMNDLRGDPELRKRYQFWMFFYSTGNPILASGARFRKSLTDLRAQLDPDQNDPGFDSMVVIGHSMGGLLSRLAISNSGQTLWNTATNVPPEQIEMEPRLKDLLTQALLFEPVPSIRRVIFVSTPHRGSPMGDELIGRLASRFIRVPSDILTIRKTLAQYNGKANVSEAFRGTRYATSVAQLSQGNPVLQAINQIPISEKVAYHSIVGHNGKEPLPQGGDGVVPYMSGHLEGALSELIVSSGHSAQETDEAIREMRRILTLHFQEYEAHRTAFAAGKSSPSRITRPDGQTPVRHAEPPPRENEPTARRLAEKGVPLDLRLIR